MQKKINIGGVEVAFRASAATTIFYKEKFGKDILKEFGALSENSKEGSILINELSSEQLNCIFRLAYIMAKQANSNLTDNFVEWLDSFEEFPMQKVVGEIINLWIKSTYGNVVPKKVRGSRQGK